MLAADGVRLDAVVRTDEPTTLALAELDETGSAKYRFYERATSAPGLTPEMALASLPPAVGILHVGTLGLTLEPTGTALEAVVEELSGQALVMVDPNIRPWVIGDADRYRRRLRRVLARSDVVKVSEEDLAWLEPQRSAATAARMLLQAGPRVVLLTRGPDGVQVVTGAGDVPVPRPRSWWPTPSAPATRSAAASWPGGAPRASAASSWPIRTRSSRRPPSAQSSAARTVERPGASPPFLHELGLTVPPVPAS